MSMRLQVVLIDLDLCVNSEWKGSEFRQEKFNWKKKRAGVQGLLIKNTLDCPMD